MTPDAPDESELLRWRISKRAFALRCCLLLVLTILACVPILPYVNMLIWLMTATVIAAFYMWIFDDFMIWYANRKTVWHLTNRAIYIQDPDSFEPMVLPLTEIEKVARFSLWSIRLRLPSRQSITLPLVPDVTATKARIIAAREAAHAG